MRFKVSRVKLDSKPERKKRSREDSSADQPCARPRIECLTLTPKELNGSDIVRKVQVEKPEVIFTSGPIGTMNWWRLQELHHESRGYFVHVDRRGVQTNSAANIAEVHLAGGVQGLSEVVNPVVATPHPTFVVGIRPGASLEKIMGAVNGHQQASRRG